MIPLTQPQFIAVANATAALFPADRDLFLDALARELDGAPVGDGTLGRLIARTQRQFSHPEPEKNASRWDGGRARFEHASKRNR